MERLKLRTYGHGNTMHGTNHVDVETNGTGQVVAVWFRCQPLPFQQTRVDTTRAKELRLMHEDITLPKMHAVVLED